jgi:hypothetical protein
VLIQQAEYIDNNGSMVKLSSKQIVLHTCKCELYYPYFQSSYNIHFSLANGQYIHVKYVSKIYIMDIKVENIKHC